MRRSVSFTGSCHSREEIRTRFTAFMNQACCALPKAENISLMSSETKAHLPTRKNGIIVGAMAIEGNVFDGHTLKPQLEKVMEFTQGKIKKAIVDRVYRGKDSIEGTEIVLPNTKKKENHYLKKQRQVRCQLRAGIEGLISHLKLYHRMLRNYLKGTAGGQINTLLAAATYNMMKWMWIKRQEIFVFIFQ